MIYLDNCATTKVRPEIIDDLVDSLKNEYANPSSLHTFGMKIEEKLEDSRDTISKFLNIRPEELYFTSGGTESNNLFINGVIEKNKAYGNKIITTNMEHSAVGEVFKKYESLGFEVCYLNCDEYGKVDLYQLENLVDDKTILVSIIHVNNELGTINDIKTACEIVKSKNKNAIFHSDGVQALGKIPINLKELGVDGYSISGHKIHALKGTGALYIKKGLNINPLVLGGNQEKGMRSGTENTNGVFSLGKAVEILSEKFSEEDNAKKELRKRIVEYIEKNIDDYTINTPLENSPNSILNISFLHTKGEVILHYLEKDKIYISTTSACSSNKKVRSNLEKIGKSQGISDGSIRICLSYENTLEEIDYFLEKLKFAVEDIRKITKRKR